MLLRLTVVFVILFTTAQISIGQYWKPVRIPEDRIQPKALVFADSLIGYFYGVVPYQYVNGMYQRGRYYWYRTLDGGRTWNPIQFHDSLFNGEYYIENGERKYYRFNANHQKRGIVPSPTSRTVILSHIEERKNDMTTLPFYRSTDQGMTWRELYSNMDQFNVHLVASHADNHLIGINNSGAYFPVVSMDGGKTYQPIEGDNTYLNATSDTNNKGTIHRLMISLTCPTPDRWMAVVVPQGDNDAEQKRSGLTTLNTRDGGAKWSYHHYYLPEDSSLWIRGEPQSIPGTSSVYFVTRQRYVRPWADYEYIYGGLSNQKTSYLYSSDYGATWTADTTFHKRRVAFFAPSPGNVWMTLWRYNPTDTVTVIGSPDSSKKSNMYADVIVHTTDFGNTWSIDSMTLHPLEFLPRDGSIMYFSDTNHGWIAASNKEGTWIYRYVAPQEQATTIYELPNYGYRYVLYPNPADQSFTVRFIRLQRIEIYDVLGRKYHCTYKFSGENSATIDCSNLNPGNYFVRMIAKYGSQEKVLTRPFSIQR